jgi:hypothetical protein
VACSPQFAAFFARWTKVVALDEQQLQQRAALSVEFGGVVVDVPDLRRHGVVHDVAKRPPTFTVHSLHEP